MTACREETNNGSCLSQIHTVAEDCVDEVAESWGERLEIEAAEGGVGVAFELA